MLWSWSDSKCVEPKFTGIILDVTVARPSCWRRRDEIQVKRMMVNGCLPSFFSSWYPDFEELTLQWGCMRSELRDYMPRVWNSLPITWENTIQRKLLRKIWRLTCSQRIIVYISFAQIVQLTFFLLLLKVQWACCCSINISTLNKLLSSL